MIEPQVDAKKKRVSEQFMHKIKMKAYTEQIGNVVYVYSILKKRNDSSTSYNERFLVLKGNQTIGYARSLPANTLLPFYNTANIPKLKKQFDLHNIKNVLIKDLSFMIQFIPQLKQANWQFQCNSKGSALQWQTIIKNATQQSTLIKANQSLQVNIPQNNQVQNNNINPNNQNLNNIPINQNNFQNKNVNNLQLNNNHHNPNNNYYQNNINSRLNNNFPLQMFNSAPNQNNVGQINPIINNSNPNNNLYNPINQGQLYSNVESNQKQRLQKLSYQNNNNNNNNLRQQYLRKKRQQQKMKGYYQQNINQSPKNNSLALHSQIKMPDQKIIASNWDYQFLKGQSQYIIIQRFKLYCEQIITIIINQLALEQKKRKYKPIQESSTYLIYQIERISIYVAFLQLHQTNYMQDRSTIISNSKVKKLKNQFKNSDYILQITKNKGRFRVPLMMITQYKGFTILTKAKVHSTNDYSTIENLLQQDIRQLQRDTKISRTIFQDEQNIKAISADQKIFEKLSRSQNKYKKFDNCFLININHYLPQDFYGYNKQSSNSHKLRAQLLQDEQYDDLLFNGSNLNLVLSRVKVPTQTRDAINILTDMAKTIPQRAMFLIQSIEHLDRIITNSQELSNLIHSNGINIRYLGFMHDNTKQTWLKKIFLSEIVARSAKYFLKYDLQDSLVNLNSTSLEETKEYQIGQVLGWVNRIFGIGPQSDSIWRQIFRQAQFYFKCSVNRQNVHVGFLIQALQYHGKFRLQNITFREPFFKANNIFVRSHFIKFIITSKCYNLNFTQHYSLINSKINNLSLQSYEQLSSILNLDKRQSLDSHYKINKMHEKIIIFLINWLSPQNASYLYSINHDDLPNKLFYDLQITAIKWQLKNGRIKQAQKIRDDIIEHINKWLGQSYPILTELYQIFSRFYLNYRSEQKNAVSYCKSMLKNQEKLLGVQHVKLADGYYQLADIYLNYGKKVQALQSYKKALQILDHNNVNDTQAFIEINIKVSQMYLANNAIVQALKSAYKSLQLSKLLNNNDLFLQSAELIGRCYEVNQNWTQYMKFIDEISYKILDYKQSQSNLQKILKVILFPIFHSIAIRSRQSSKIIKSIIHEFQERNGLNQMSYLYIKTKIQEKTFPNVFFSFLDNIQTILRQIQTSGLMNRWKGFQNMGVNNRSRAGQMVAFLQSLYRLLVGGFIQGIFDYED